ncbi:MAG: GAF domain-containing protein, partial [Actinomycetota bacterium]|nr:GAF domain-containing protein [Actinomycetota bacterium]
MGNVFRCPECGAPNHVFAALNESLLAISGNLALETVLQRVVGVARGLIHASFGAVGVAGEHQRLRYLITSPATGSSGDAHVAGIFSALLDTDAPYTTSDVQSDSRFAGWPPGYPDLKSFLSVPIVGGDEIVGRFYLGNENTWGFTPDHRSLVELLAPHAGIAITNARLYEQSRELSVAGERDRIARELHDAM